MTLVAYPAAFQTYPTKRDYLLKWAKTHYVDEFNLKPGKLLDVGCAEGFWADVFCDLGFEAHGFDKIAVYIENGRERYPRVELQVADVEDLPYEEKSFDVVFARTLPFFYAYRLAGMKRALTSLLSLVRENGTLLLSFYSKGSGEKHPGLYRGSHWHHPHKDLLHACSEVSGVKHYAKVGNYLQVAL